jgi:hypothetical protein
MYIHTYITDKIVLGKNASEGPPSFTSATLSNLYEELSEVKMFMENSLLPVTTGFDLDFFVGGIFG